MSETVEYSLFNELPGTHTIDQIPENQRWMYTEPFGRVYESYERNLAESEAMALNRDRLEINWEDWNLVRGTSVVVKHRHVIKTEWKSGHCS